MLMNRLRILAPTIIFMLASASVVQAQTLNQKVVTYLNTKVGVRVGGGECAHVASEAIRVAGGEFITSLYAADSPAAGDYVWGTLVKKVEYASTRWTDSSPTAKALPGDVMQYYNTKLVSGTVTWIATRHTSIVAAVDTAGMPTLVYEQNISGIRTVRKNAIDLRTLKNYNTATAGWVRIYRPVARVQKFQFAILNNTAVAQTATIKYGTQNLGSVPLTAINTGGSYVMLWIGAAPTFTGLSLVLSNEKSIALADFGCYEVYTGTDGKPAWRKLLQ
jgi:hypothetical protein